MAKFKVGDKVLSTSDCGYNITNSQVRVYPLIVTQVWDGGLIRVGVDPRELGSKGGFQNLDHVIDNADIVGYEVHPDYFVLARAARDRTLVKKVV